MYIIVWMKEFYRECVSILGIIHDEVLFLRKDTRQQHLFPALLGITTGLFEFGNLVWAHPSNKVDTYRRRYERSNWQISLRQNQTFFTQWGSTDSPIPSHLAALARYIYFSVNNKSFEQVPLHWRWPICILNIQIFWQAPHQTNN